MSRRCFVSGDGSECFCPGDGSECFCPGDGSECVCPGDGSECVCDPPRHHLSSGDCPHIKIVKKLG